MGKERKKLEEIAEGSNSSLNKGKIPPSPTPHNSGDTGHRAQVPKTEKSTAVSLPSLKPQVMPNLKEWFATRLFLHKKLVTTVPVDTAPVTGGWVDGWTDGQMGNGEMDGWGMGGWKDGWGMGE